LPSCSSDRWRRLATLGIGLAIALAIWAWQARSLRLWIAAPLVAVLGCIPTILAAGAPFSERSAACLECGMTREMHEVCGWTTKDEISETEASRWAAPLVPRAMSMPGR
jgi:hypothetical protein